MQHSGLRELPALMDTAQEAAEAEVAARGAGAQAAQPKDAARAAGPTAARAAPAPASVPVETEAAALAAEFAAAAAVGAPLLHEALAAPGAAAAGSARSPGAAFSPRAFGRSSPHNLPATIPALDRSYARSAASPRGAPAGESAHRGVAAMPGGSAMAAATAREAMASAFLTGTLGGAGSGLVPVPAGSAVVGGSAALGSLAGRSPSPTGMRTRQEVVEEVASAARDVKHAILAAKAVQAQLTQALAEPPPVVQKVTRRLPGKALGAVRSRGGQSQSPAASTSAAPLLELAPTISAAPASISPAVTL